MNQDEILLSKEDAIVILTLNRTDKLNALTIDMVDRLPGIVEDIRMDDSLKVLIITGAGRSFCAGADVGRMGSGYFSRDRVKTRREVTSPPGYQYLALSQLEKPTIAAINGIAVGAGISIALACDIRIASEQARFTAAWVKRGLIPDAGATYFLPRLLGISKALELMFTGDVVDAAEAERIGLVNRVVPHDDLMTVTRELARKIAEGPSVAIELMKRVAYMGLVQDLETQFNFESYAQRVCTRTEDHKEGIEAFMQKRQPQFKGR